LLTLSCLYTPRHSSIYGTNRIFKTPTLTLFLTLTIIAVGKGESKDDESFAEVKGEIDISVTSLSAGVDDDIEKKESSSSSSIEKTVSTEDLAVKSEEYIDTLIKITEPTVFAIPGTTQVEIVKGVFLKDDTEDVDDTLESEHFDTRQSFLNLCQGNHYQFDQLRRAKHTSMMVLYHMHNPDAPKFVPNCTVCHKDILVGHKYRCEPCEQDYCPACYGQHGSRVHLHPLRIMAVSAVVAPPTLTDEQRRQRQQAIDLHLTLLVHASSCVLGSDCKSRHCQKMKVFTDFFS
jgi:hypothetical protein